jgi:putative transposase
MAIESIQIAIDNGARQHQSCGVVGISSRTLQNWRATGMNDRRKTAQKIPMNKLSQQERDAIIHVCNNDEFKSQTPKQIVPALADRGIYMASESSFYRILRDAEQLQHRGRTASPAATKKPDPYRADAPNQVWSWDITYLASNLKGVFFYLYLFMDIYSRKIVGWEVYENESSEQAADVLRKTRLAEALAANHEVVLHSDNGSPMKGATMLATMQKLGIVPSFSRPSVSNDNPFSESLFKTLKYVPSYPSKPFESLDEARRWVETFADWYNYSHHHSGLKFVTPVQRHNGVDIAILERRKSVYEEARKQHPERWSGEIRNWDHEAMVMLNPVNMQQQDNEMKKAA